MYFSVVLRKSSTSGASTLNPIRRCVSALPVPVLVQASQSGTFDRLVGLVVQASASRSPDLGSIPACAMDLVLELSDTSDVKIGTPVVTLPGVRGSAV